MNGFAIRSKVYTDAEQEQESSNDEKGLYVREERFATRITQGAPWFHYQGGAIHNLRSLDKGKILQKFATSK